MRLQMKHFMFLVNRSFGYKENIVVDKKTEFVLSLQGKESRGHLAHWCISHGDLVGLKCGKYQLTARDTNYEIINNEYATYKHSYVTLGKKIQHTELLKIYGKRTVREDE